MSEALLCAVIGWFAGSTTMWLYFAASGLIRDSEEWNAHRERMKQ